MGGWLKRGVEFHVNRKWSLPINPRNRRWPPWMNDVRLRCATSKQLWRTQRKSNGITDRTMGLKNWENGDGIAMRALGERGLELPVSTETTQRSENSSTLVYPSRDLRCWDGRRIRHECMAIESWRGIAKELKKKKKNRGEKRMELSK